MKAASALFFPSASAFGPYLVKRSWTSAGFKPVLGSTPNFVRISATVGLADPVASSVGMNSSSTHSVRGSVITWYVHPRPEKRPRNRCNRLKGGTRFSELARRSISARRGVHQAITLVMSSAVETSLIVNLSSCLATMISGFTFVTNRNHSVLYIGVTNRLSRRVWEHREESELDSR